MAKGHTVRLGSEASRDLACSYILAAPSGYISRVEPPVRTGEQNDKMWAMLSDISRSKPDGRRHTPEDWKAVFMNACGWEVQFIEGLDGRPFPSGFRSSRMSKSQMADLITYIQAYGDEHGVEWGE